jgi:catechol 2,3-dioxygenase-like lactoylglutathione lyase family enzyme
MSAPPLPVAFHVGIVVRDIEAVIDRYKRMLGLDIWHVRDRGNGRKLAYGGRDGTGFAFELIQPGPNEDDQMTQFLAESGEGVQHIGFWTPDLLGSLKTAVAEGAQLVAGGYEAKDNTVVQMDLPSDAPTLLRHMAYLEPGAGKVRFELFGPPGNEGLKSWLGEDYDKIIAQVPW